MASRKPLAFAIRVVSAAAAAYIVVTAIEAYHPKSPTCLSTVLQRGVESMPSYCKLPIWQFVIAFFILLVGIRAAVSLEKRAA